MKELELLPFGDPFLNNKPSEFDFEKEDARELSLRLFHAMGKAGGIGLSANQVGLDMKVFVMGGNDKVPSKAIFNPKLQSVSDKMVSMKEGCLSYPGLWLMIKRPLECSISYQDETGAVIAEGFSGFAARVVLHEYDHMLGQNFTQRASSLKLQRAMKHMDKKVKNFKRGKNV